MFSASSRATTPARFRRGTRMRRLLVLNLTAAFTLGLAPFGISVATSQPATATPIVATATAENHASKTPYQQCLDNYMADQEPTPGVWAVCHGYLSEEEYLVSRRHSATMTREQLVNILYRMAGSPTVKDLPTTSPYADVTTDDPSYAAIIWAADAGLTAGWEDGLFHGDTPASRHTLAAFLYRSAGSPDGAVQIRRPKAGDRARTTENPERFVLEGAWLERTLGKYPSADRDGDGVEDTVKASAPLFFSDALYMLKAYDGAGLKVVGTPAH